MAKMPLQRKSGQKEIKLYSPTKTKFLSINKGGNKKPVPFLSVSFREDMLKEVISNINIIDNFVIEGTQTSVNEFTRAKNDILYFVEFIKHFSVRKEVENEI